MRKQGSLIFLQWPTLITLSGIVLLLSLGTWQIYRLHWKQNLISLLETRFALPPEKIDNVRSFKLSDLEFRRIRVTGVFVDDRALKLQGRTHEGKLGYHLIVPLQLAGGSRILIDRGWVPFTDPYSPGKLSGAFSIEGYIRLHSDRNFMTPQNRYEEKEIYALYPGEIASHFHMNTLLPFYIVQTEPLDKSPFPVPATFSFSLRNFHLQYAITWYVLALLLGIVYILYLRRQRGTF